jgi:hypothetical protein
MLAQHAQAGTATYYISGAGVSGHVTLNFAPDTYVGDPAGTYIVTAATGVFSDPAFSSSPLSITGVESPGSVDSGRPTGAPYTFSNFAVTDGFPNPGAPGGTAYSLSYDNALYPAGTTVICDGFGPGGQLDVFGLLFTLGNGDVLNLWSDGTGTPVANAPGIYGFSIADGTQSYGYVFEGVSFATPEPSTWAMMALGFAGLGFAGYRKRQGVPVPA